MPALALRLAALWIGLSGPQGLSSELPATGEVVADALAEYTEPDGSSIGSRRLRKGDVIRVVDMDAVSGWLTIEPSPSAFDWVERSAVRIESKETARARVAVPTTVVRTGIEGARLPGPPRAVLTRGETVRIVARPPLITSQGSKAVSWLAIAPPKGEVRYVRAEGVAWPRPEPPRETRASFEEAKISADPNLPPEIAAIDAEYRAMRHQPIEQWQLAPIRSRYDGILKRTNDAAVAEALRGRLEQVARHEELARSARAFQTILERSRRLDRKVAVTLNRLAELDSPGRRPFVAEGLMQASSRLVDGHRVYALIGRDGEPIAYLDVPPGLDARPALTKRVGVRGSVRYDENLGSRLIAVKDLEPLE